MAITAPRAERAARDTAPALLLQGPAVGAAGDAASQSIARKRRWVYCAKVAG